MKFVFYDKSDLETDIITDILYTEKIPYKIKSKEVDVCFFDEEEEICDCVVKTVYNIYVNTDLDHFDFVNTIAEKKIMERVHLEFCYMKEEKERNVQRVHKKSSTNTNSRNKSKQRRI